MKIESIGSQLRSKEAISNASLLADGLRKEAVELRMRANSSSFHAAQVVPKGIAAANRTEGVNFFKSLDKPKAQSTGGKAGGGATGGPEGQALTAQNNVTKIRESIPKFASMASNRTGIPQKQLEVSMNNWINETSAKAQLTNPKNPGKAFYEIAEEERKDVMKDPRVQAVMQEEKKGVIVGRLRRANSTLTASFKNDKGEVDYAKIDSLLGQDWKEMVGTGGVNFVRKKGTAMGLNDREMDAAVRYASELQGVINDYGHDLFGGALTSAGSGGGEIGRLDQVVSAASSFRQLENFTQSRSHALSTAIKTKYVALNPRQAMMLGIFMGGAKEQKVSSPGYR
jgi:hypothetical protein